MLDKKISPMLAYSSDPFDSPKHIFEIKWDGTRCIMFIDGKDIRLQNRRLIDITYRYPEFLQAPNEIEVKNAILDGEIVIFHNGKTNFNKLQQREHIEDPLKIKLLSRSIPATYIVFDILYLNDKKYIQKPLIERKEILRKILNKPSSIMESRYINEKGIAYFNEVVGLGFEGIMAKSINSPYLIGKRSRYWLKIKPKSSRECFIVGYTLGKGERSNLLGSLVIATLERGKWIFRGKVGSGFDDKTLKEIFSMLKNLEIDKIPIPNLGRQKDIIWVKPLIRCEVSFQEITEKGHFRAPVFKRLIE